MDSAALPTGPLPQAAHCPAAYRPRNPRATSLYQLLETHSTPSSACGKNDSSDATASGGPSGMSPLPATSIVDCSNRVSPASLLSWRHSGFGVHNATTVYPSDTEGLHKLACYLMRSPVNLSRLRYHPPSELFLYQPKAGHELDDQALLDPLEFLARVLLHVPEPNKHRVHFYGGYANRVRASYRRHDTTPPDESDDLTPPRRRLSRRWAQLIYRIYEVDPLDDDPSRRKFRSISRPG